MPDAFEEASLRPVKIAGHDPGARLPRELLTALTSLIGVDENFTRGDKFVTHCIFWRRAAVKGRSLESRNCPTPPPGRRCAVPLDRGKAYPGFPASVRVAVCRLANR